MHSAADDSVAMQSELSLLNVALICMKRLKNAVGIVSSALKHKNTVYHRLQLSWVTGYLLCPVREVDIFVMYV